MSLAPGTGIGVYQIAAQIGVGEALEAAHEQGIIDRDLKPAQQSQRPSTPGIRQRRRDRPACPIDLRIIPVN